MHENYHDSSDRGFADFSDRKYKASDCHDQGYKILEKIATYYGPGPDQGWVLNDSNIGVAGWYCQ